MYVIVGAELDNPNRPYLLDAWSEEMVRNNPAGWEQALAEEQASVEHLAAPLVLEVPDEVALAALSAERPDTA